ncbi:glycosyltransferase family 2 protein [Leisingera sp. ANG-Vp]|uniref:glycosyltransferase family 2 protein n=1 Tax=Leisingera sp. ANG-Vp TaxID=1577896 RepID=UPI00057D4EFD|nr:glycosyltransferase family 2 protein [Leisingera sp. ANG-Vp]KIC20604.1 glycosyl transferase family 2 [Leisingera sp. ANG-Vp]
MASPAVPDLPPLGLTGAYKLRWKRRRLLWRSLRARRQLRKAANRTAQIPNDPILCFATVRNEMGRLPFYLEHYRRAGVSHFLFVDNASTDGTAAYLAAQPDVSLWHTGASYRGSRFGVDWLTWLQIRYGHGAWCLTADADEILTYPHADSRSLRDLTRWLDQQGAASFGAMMLDMYPKGALGTQASAPGADPFETLNWFDAGGYTWEYLDKFGQVSIRGGPRKRMFFRDSPDYAPHLHKVPLVRWNRRYAYVSSSHTVLPRHLNAVFDTRLNRPTGVLLHSKFLDEIVGKSAEEKQRRQHFTHTDRYDAYYDALIAGPDLWCENSVRYEGWRQLEQLGLMTRGSWQ